MSSAAVQVAAVSKRFRLGETHDSLRDLLVDGLGRAVGRRSRRREPSWLWALHDVTFSVGSGEAFGIIGPNGAGKSTMLRLLAGILRADRGHVQVNGRLAALIEVGAGFHGDLTGRENIFLNGAILGMTRREIRSKLDAIVRFAGLEAFLDTPVKRYSSGMYARLGFSIAAHVDPDVLLVDEVLSVGDAVFRLRCVERMRDLVRSGTTLIFVTHNLDQMRSICDRALVLEHGRDVYQGLSRSAVSHYLDAVSRTQAARPTDLPARLPVRAHTQTGARLPDSGRSPSGTQAGVPSTGAAPDATAAVAALRFLNQAGEPIVWVRPGEPLRAVLTFRLTRPIEKLVVELNLRAETHENVLSFNSGRDGLTFEAPMGVQTVTLALEQIPLAGGPYFWNVRLWDAETGHTLVDTPPAFPMVIDDEGRAAGLLTLDRNWSFIPQPTDAPTASTATMGRRPLHSFSLSR